MELSGLFAWGSQELRRRRNLRGNVIGQETRQINLKIVEAGKRPLGVIFGVEEEVPADQSSGEEE